VLTDETAATRDQDAVSRALTIFYWFEWGRREKPARLGARGPADFVGALPVRCCVDDDVAEGAATGDIGGAIWCVLAPSAGLPYTGPHNLMKRKTGKNCW
jgi:hypothetical protein